MKQIIFIAAICLHTLGFAQIVSNKQFQFAKLNERSPGVVTCTAHAPAKVKAGEAFELSLTFTMQEGWYIYAPTGRNRMEGMTETSIGFELPKGFINTDKMLFPKPMPHGRFQVYEGNEIKMIQKLTTESLLAPGKYTVRINVIYQTCSGQMCLPPKHEVLTIDIEIK